MGHSQSSCSNASAAGVVDIMVDMIIWYFCLCAMCCNNLCLCCVPDNKWGPGVVHESNCVLDNFQSSRASLRDRHLKMIK